MEANYVSEIDTKRDETKMHLFWIKNKKIV